ncbi:MAG: zf-HC2 domain-containing protein, partial [Candidatus Riflebacteria bacterium]|nr:zf-HC2 domain-containing protein [Candidatus Riflebacteria bacterium]
MDRVTPDSTGPQRPVPDCETARAALSARLDGQLDSPEASWLERHLGGCPACRTAEHELAVLQRLLMEGPVPRETELIASRRSILGSAFGSTGRLASGSGMWPRWLSWGLAPALGLALTVAALWTGAGPTRQSPPSSDRPG